MESMWFKSFKWSGMFRHSETVPQWSWSLHPCIFTMLTWLYDSCRLCWWGVTAASASACLLYTHLLTLTLSHSFSLLFQIHISSYFHTHLRCSFCNVPWVQSFLLIYQFVKMNRMHSNACKTDKLVWQVASQNKYEDLSIWHVLLCKF